MPNLVTLDMQRCGLQDLPISVVDSPYLECLTLSENNFYPTACNRHAEGRHEVELLVQDLHAGGLLTDAQDSRGALPVNRSVQRSTPRSAPRDSVAVERSRAGGGGSHRRPPAVPSSSSSSSSAPLERSPRGQRRAPSVPASTSAASVSRSPVPSRSARDRQYGARGAPVIRATGPPPAVPSSVASSGGKDPRLERAQATIAQLREQLDVRNNEVDLKEADLRAMREQLAERDRQVASHSRDAARVNVEHQRALDAERAAVDQAHREMDRLEAALASKEHDAADGKARLSSLTNLLRKKDAEIQELAEDRLALGGTRRDLERLEGIIAAKDDELHDTKGRLTSLTSLLRKKDAEIVQTADALAKAEAEVQLVLAEQKIALDNAYGELDQSTAEARERENRSKLMHSELQKTRSFLEEKDKELQQAYADLDAKQLTIGDNAGELDAAYKDIDEKNRIIDKNYERIRGKDEDLKELRAEHEALKGELVALTVSFQEQQEALTTAQADGDAKVSRTLGSLETLQDEHARLQEAFAQKEEQLAQAREEHQDAAVELQSKIDQLGVDLMEKEGQLEKAHAVIEEQKVALSETAKDLDAAYGELEDRNAVIEEYKQTILGKDGEIAGMGKDTDVLLDTLADVRETLSETQATLKDTSERLAKTEEDLRVESAQHEETRNSLARLEELSAEQKDELFRLKTELASTQQTLAETDAAMNSAYDDLQIAYDDLSATQTALAAKEDALDASYSESGKAAAQLRRTLQEQQVAAEAHQFELEQVRAHAAQRELDLEQQLEEKIQRLKATYTDLDDKRKIISESVREGREMEDDLRDKLAAKEEAFNDAMDELEEANETIEALKADKAEKQTALAAAYAKLADAMESVDELHDQDAAAKVERMSEQLREKQARVEELSARVQSLEEERDSAREQLAHMKESMQEKDEKLAETEEQLVEKEEQLAEKDEKLAEKQDQQQQQQQQQQSEQEEDALGASPRRRAATTRPAKPSTLGAPPGKPRGRIPGRLRSGSVPRMAPGPPRSPGSSLLAAPAPLPPSTTAASGEGKSESPLLGRAPLPPPGGAPRKPPGRPAPQMAAPKPPL